MAHRQQDTGCIHALDVIDRAIRSGHLQGLLIALPGSRSRPAAGDTLPRTWACAMA
jgi:hypothetical protein